MNDPQLRPLTDEENLVLEYVRRNPGVNAEGILNFFADYDDVHLRQTFASAIGYLRFNLYLQADDLQNLTVKGI